MYLLIQFFCSSYSETGTSAGPDLNFPLPGETGTPCLVKVCWLSTELSIDQDKHFESEQGSHRLKKYLNIQDCLEKSLKIKYALKST